MIAYLSATKASWPKTTSFASLEVLLWLQAPITLRSGDFAILDVV
jgi:hypothetical protein